MVNDNVMSIPGSANDIKTLLRPVFRAAVVGTGMLNHGPSGIKFNEEEAGDFISALGLTTFSWSDTFQSDDAAVDATLNAYVQKITARTAAA